jgi:hypothetical protein
MNITLQPEIENRIRARAEAEGISIETYLERLVQADQQGLEELEALALAGLESGAPIDVGPAYWQEKHRRLDERLKNSQKQ